MTHQKNLAEPILKAYQTYRTRFDHITRNAKTRFTNRDWKAVQSAAAERISLYRRAVDGAVEEISALIGEKRGDKALWGETRTAYSSLISDRCDWEIAETFYNSVTRRIFSTVGVDEEIEFVTTDFEAPPTKPSEQIYQTFPADGGMEKLAADILRGSELSDLFEDPDTDARLGGQRIEAVLAERGLLAQVERAEIIRKVFYRSMGGLHRGPAHRKREKDSPLIEELYSSPDLLRELESHAKGDHPAEGFFSGGGSCLCGAPDQAPGCLHPGGGPPSRGKGRDRLRPVHQGSGPYFYLPKLESHHEAKLWNDIFVTAQDLLSIPQTSIEATVLIETILAAFEMDEIIYELKDHMAGLNCGRRRLLGKEI